MTLRTPTVSLIIFVAALSIANTANSQWWNPLAPRDYNDCIIKNLKQGMSENAVRALQYACIEKYPAPKEPSLSKPENNQTELRYKKCRIDQDHYKLHTFIGIGDKHEHKTHLILDNLKNFKYDRQQNSVSFQNMNNFGLSGVLVGFTKAKQCHTDIKDFSFTAYCTGQRGTESGISSNSYGTLKCGSLPEDAKAMGFCKIGYSPTYNKFDESLIIFLETNNYCN
jgi:hypothetical protein